MNKYIKVIDGNVQGPTVPHGQPTKSHSWCENSTAQEYADAGYYLIIPNKPDITNYQKMDLTGYTVNDEDKTVTGVWTITDYPQDVIDEIVEREKKEIEKSSGIFANLTMEQAESYIDSNVTDLASAKTALKKIVKLILART